VGALTIHLGDCVSVMAAMPPDSIDAIVCDPPYGLEFMGKEWDRLDAGLPQETVWKGRRGKGGSSVSDDDRTPGARHNVGFGGGKAGFKRCTICGKRAFSGSPCECPEPSYVIEYPAGPPSSMVRMGRWHEQWATAALRVAKPGAYLLAFGGTRTVHRMTVALEDAGWIIRDMLVWAYASGFPKSRALLKPAWEPIVMARKPGPLRDLDIDGCRIGTTPDDAAAMERANTPGSARMLTGHGLGGSDTFARLKPTGALDTTAGRWPANVVLTDPIFDGGWEGVVGGGEASYNPAGVFGRQQVDQPTDTSAPFAVRKAGDGIFGYGDTGTYSRFFLVPKASRSDREPVMPGMLEERPWEGHDPQIAFGNRVCRNCGHGQFDGRRSGPCCDSPDYAPGQVGKGGGARRGARLNAHPT
jgi:hypothetical protein